MSMPLSTLVIENNILLVFMSLQMLFYFLFDVQLQQTERRRKTGLRCVM